MTSKEALNNLRFAVSIAQDSPYKETNDLCDIIEKALDRLEQLEIENKKWREIVGCDLCEALGREILLEENKKLQKENQELETDKKILNALYQEVKDTASFYMSKCEKFEKVIEILKKYLYLVMDDSGFIINADSHLLKEEYDLLKEFLKNV